MQINDEYWMAQALQLARKGLYTTHPNPRVGCVVVYNQTLISQGWHEYCGGAHAEINAIENASIPTGSDFFVTLEPCSHHGKTPPCVFPWCELVMHELQRLDQVAYIRFASVYLSFEDIQAFEEMIKTLEAEPTPEMHRRQVPLIEEDT